MEETFPVMLTWITLIEPVLQGGYIAESYIVALLHLSLEVGVAQSSTPPVDIVKCLSVIHSADPLLKSRRRGERT